MQMNALGQKYMVAVDDRIPVHADKQDKYVLMADGVNNTMWGPLLEKAYAKFLGGYSKLDQKGLASEAIHTLTNLPGFAYHTNQTQFLFDKISTALNNTDVVTCSSGPKSTQSAQQNEQGINLAHTYSVLGAVRIPTQQEPVELLYVRDPWAQDNQTFNGTYSRISDFNATILR